MSQSWKRLHLSDPDVAPPLLYKFTSTSSSYELYLTDLTHMWSEHLDYNGIIKRAERDNTSIDPSEDSEQFRILLKKVGDALQGEDDSRVVLKPGKQRNALEVIATTELPAPLKSLKWTLSLSREPPTTLTKELFLPLLKGGLEHERRERSLLNHLKEKDWVLGKIFDKIDSSGLDLSAVFPGVAALRGPKRGTTLSHAAKHVKGVGPFDESLWRSGFRDETSGSSIAADLIDQISDSSAASKLDDLPVANDRWWDDLEASEVVSPPSTKTKPEARAARKRAASVATDSSSDSNDGEFQVRIGSPFNSRININISLQQRQRTPPHLKHKKPVQKDHNVTESDKEPGPTHVSRKSSTPPRHQQTAELKGLGRIGGPQPVPKSTKPASSLSTESDDSLDRSKHPTKSPIQEETESDDASPLPRQKSAKGDVVPDKAASSSSSQTRGLGRIGGNKKQPELKPESRERSSPDAGHQSTDEEARPKATREKPTQKTKPAGRLGAIGGKKASLPSRTSAPTPAPAAGTTTADLTASENDESDDLDARQRGGGPSSQQSLHNKSHHPASSSVKPPSSPSSSSSPPPPKKRSVEPERELTAQEKADKKREDLKRLLDAQTKAPVKKKRKF